MKLGPVTKVDKRKKTTSKCFNDEVMSENCNVIAIFKFIVNLKESGRWILVTFYFIKTANRTKYL